MHCQISHGKQKQARGARRYHTLGAFFFLARGSVPSVLTGNLENVRKFVTFSKRLEFLGKHRNARHAQQNTSCAFFCVLCPGCGFPRKLQNFENKEYPNIGKLVDYFGNLQFFCLLGVLCPQSLGNLENLERIHDYLDKSRLSGKHAAHAEPKTMP